MITFCSWGVKKLGRGGGAHSEGGKGGCGRSLGKGTKMARVRVYLDDIQAGLFGSRHGKERGTWGCFWFGGGHKRNPIRLIKRTDRSLTGRNLMGIAKTGLALGGCS